MGKSEVGMWNVERKRYWILDARFWITKKEFL